jgi:hypothetical protein
MISLLLRLAASSFIIGIGAVAHAHAQDVIELGERDSMAEFAEMWHRYGTAMENSIGACDSAPAKLSFRQRTVLETHTFRVTGWTGGCREGKRDGPGTLSLQSEYMVDYPEGGFDDYSSSDSSEARGELVAGRQVGLWCEARKSGSINGRLEGATPEHCKLGGSDFSYVREDDGRWHQLNGLKPSKPDVYVVAGELERESARLLAAARAGVPAVPRSLTAVVPAFRDLIAGGGLKVPANETPIVLSSRRVAIVLSARAIAELARFRAMRQSLIDVSAKDQKVQVERARFISESDPAQVLAGFTAAIKAHGGAVVPADDLSALQTDSADYAIVVDWHYEGEFALSAKDYKSIDPCPDQIRPRDCRRFFRDAFSFALLDRDLVVQGMGDWDNTDSWIFYFYSDTMPYSTLFETLARGFKSRWKVDDGSVRLSVDGWLESMKNRRLWADTAQ